MSPVLPHAPDNVRWTHLTPEVLASDQGDELRRQIERFDPLDHDAGAAMAGWLRAVADGSEEPKDETHLVSAGDELLGFIAAESGTVDFSRRAWPIVELWAKIRERTPQPALLLGAIARSASATDSGFGHVLFDYAVGVALSNAAVAVLMMPDNDSVAEMWRDRYGLRAMSDPGSPGLLWFPTSPKPEQNWP